MNTGLLRKIIGLILAALLVTSIVLLAGTTAAAQRRHQQRVVRVRSAPVQSIRKVQPIRQAQLIRPFHAFGSFGRPYHPFWDPYGRYDRHTFYRRSIPGRGPN